MNTKASLFLAGLFASGFAFAQPVTDDPNNAIFNVNTDPRGSVGAFLGSETLPTPNGDELWVSAENDGAGNLQASEIINDDLFIIDGAANVLSGPFSLLPETTGLIGATVANGVNYVTDVTDFEVDIYDSSYVYQSSFSTEPDSTFPEGITFAPYNGNLFVVDGDGGNIVIEYTTAGTVVNTFPINGTSQDGIAFDNARCVFWIYDSGTDSVRSYDSAFTEIDVFPGTGANSLGGAEGLGVIGNTLYLVATGAGALASFDISGATVASNAAELCAPDLPESLPVPTLNAVSLLLLAGLMLGIAFVVRARMA